MIIALRQEIMEKQNPIKGYSPKKKKKRRASTRHNADKKQKLIGRSVPESNLTRQYQLPMTLSMTMTMMMTEQRRCKLTLFLHNISPRSPQNLK